MRLVLFASQMKMHVLHEKFLASANSANTGTSEKNKFCVFLWMRLKYYLDQFHVYQQHLVYTFEMNVICYIRYPQHFSIKIRSGFWLDRRVVNIPLQTTDPSIFSWPLTALFFFIFWKLLRRFLLHCKLLHLVIKFCTLLSSDIKLCKLLCRSLRYWSLKLTSP